MSSHPTGEFVDLRVWLLVLWRRKWQIGLIAAGAVALALGVTLLLPARYEATALVAAANPRLQVQFDARIETLVEAEPNLFAYESLALSDAVLDEVYARLPVAPAGVDSPQWLAEQFSVNIYADLIHLSASAASPAEAQQLANAWAQVFIEHANMLYANQDPDQLSGFEVQLAQAETEVAAAETALVEFETANRLEVLRGQYESALAQQAELFTRQRQLLALHSDAQALGDQFGRQAATAPAPLNLQLAALALQVRFAQPPAEGGSSAVTLQIDPGGEGAALTNAQQAALLDVMIAALETQAAGLETQSAALEPRILELQGQIEALSIEQADLNYRRSLAEETRLALARKVQEIRILIQDNSGLVRLASAALEPVEPAGFSKLIIGAAALAAGLLAGIAWAFLREWWLELPPAARRGTLANK